MLRGFDEGAIEPPFRGALTPPGGQAAPHQGAAMAPERFLRHRNPVFSSQSGPILGGGGGSQGLGKDGVAPQQRLELVQSGG